jgi:hypothetical protein
LRSIEVEISLVGSVEEAAKDSDIIHSYAEASGFL